MFGDLPASRPLRSFGRSEWTGLAGASVLHVGLLLLGGSRAAELDHSVPGEPIPVVFPNPDRPAPEAAEATRSRDALSLPERLAFDWPEGAIQDIDLSNEPVDLPFGVDPRDLFPQSAPGAGFPNGPDAAGAGGGGLVHEEVLDLPLRVRRAPEPQYPEWLRRARIEGVVTIQFVVDTAGRAEMASIAVIHADRQEFADAVIRALEQARFAPGTVRGRRVRAKVRQDFRFRIGQ